MGENGPVVIRNLIQFGVLQFEITAQTGLCYSFTKFWFCLFIGIHFTSTASGVLRDFDPCG